MDSQSPIPPSPRRRQEKEAQRQRFHLRPGPAIAGYQIQRNEENHTVVIDGLMVRCTLDEYALLLKLMEHYEQPVLFDDLIAQFRDASPTDPTLLKAARRKLTSTLSDLRAKLWSTDFTIVLVADVGYVLIHQDKLWSMTHADLNDPDERL